MWMLRQNVHENKKNKKNEKNKNCFHRHSRHQAKVFEITIRIA